MTDKEEDPDVSEQPEPAAADEIVCRGGRLRSDGTIEYYEWNQAQEDAENIARLPDAFRVTVHKVGSADEHATLVAHVAGFAGCWASGQSWKELWENLDRSLDIEYRFASADLREAVKPEVEAWGASPPMGWGVPCTWAPSPPPPGSQPIELPGTMTRELHTCGTLHRGAV